MSDDVAPLKHSAEYVADPEPEWRRCVEHNNNAGPKDRRCPTWWWQNGGDPKAGLASACKFEEEIWADV